MCVSSGVCSEEQVSWLACTFIDERVFLNAEGHRETELQPRDALLQFGPAGGAPVNPHTITFMVTGRDLKEFIVAV